MFHGGHKTTQVFGVRDATFAQVILFHGDDDLEGVPTLRDEDVGIHGKPKGYQPIRNSLSGSCIHQLLGLVSQSVAAKLGMRKKK